MKILVDRLFAVKPVRRAHSTVHEEDMVREQEFRHDAEGAGLSVAKEKLEMRERTNSLADLS